MKQIDLLAFAAHPDDVELAASGTLLAHQKLGKTIGIVDLTEGELGTRGSASIRSKESEKSASILKLDHRSNLGLADGFFQINEASLMKVVEKIRALKPSVVLANSISDRHPDHARAAKLVSEACFLAGLKKIHTEMDGVTQKAHRPAHVLHYIQDKHLMPDVIIDITPFFEQKMKSINAYASQFHQEGVPNTEPETPISTLNFKKVLEGRSRDFGRIINVTYGEAFNTSRPIGVKNLLDLQ